MRNTPTLKGLLILSLALALTSQAYAATEVFDSSGTFTIPPGVREVTFEAWGGGAGGESGGEGGGGGGGGYGKGTISVTPGSSFSITVGSGGSSGSSGGTSTVHSGITYVQGGGGNTGSGTTGGTGGVGGGTAVDATYDGGDGGNGGGSGYGGGGGGGAGNKGDGSNGVDGASGGAGGAGGSELGGDGGDGVFRSPGGKGNAFGGGGAGGGNSGDPGGSGGDGQVRATYDVFNVQRGLDSFPGTANFVNVTDINWVDPDQAFVTRTMHSSSGRPDVLLTMAQITSDGKAVELEREYGGLTSYPTDVAWELIEDPKISAQRGTESYGTGTTFDDITISSVNTSQAFVIVSSTADSSSSIELDEGLWSGRLTSNTELRLQRSVTGTASQVAWQVVEWDGSEVQSGSASMTGTSELVALSEPIDPQKSFLTFSRRGDFGSINNLQARGEIINSTHISFERAGSSGTFFIEWFVVENPRFFVQRGDTEVSGSTAIDEAIGNVSKFQTFTQSTWNSTSAARGAGPQNAYLTANLTGDASKDMTFHKGASGETQTVHWQAINVKPICDYNGVGDWTLRGEDECEISFDAELKDSTFKCLGNGFVKMSSLADITAGVILGLNGCNIQTDGGTLKAQKENFVRISDTSSSHCGAPSAGTAGFQVYSNGNIGEKEGASYSVTDSWITSMSGSGSDWEVRATKLSGNDPTGTLDSWLSLSSNRDWEITTTTTNSTTLNIEIRNSATQFVHDNAEVTLSAGGGFSC